MKRRGQEGRRNDEREDRRRVEERGKILSKTREREREVRM